MLITLLHMITLVTDMDECAFYPNVEYIITCDYTADRYRLVNLRVKISSFITLLHIYCLIDLDECAAELDTCTERQRCENTVGSFVCRRILGCGTGYSMMEETQTCRGRQY